MARLEVVISLSERKNPPEKHYKFALQKENYDQGIVDYMYDDLKFKKNVSIEHFNLNRKITNDPTVFESSKTEKTQENSDH